MVLKEITLVVLAAGLGRRYGGLKQIEPVGPNGEILIDYSLYDAYRAGFANVVFIVREEILDTFEEVIGQRTRAYMHVDYAVQGQAAALPEWFSGFETRGEKPWGTAHAVLCTKNVVHTPFAVINADDFYGRESYDLLAGFLKNAADNPGMQEFCMAGYTLKNTLSKNGFVSRGVCEEDENGYLKRVDERLKIGFYDGLVQYEDEHGALVPVSPDSTVSLNIWGFTPEVFPLLEEQREGFFQALKNVEREEFLLPVAVDGMVKTGKARVKVLKSPANWYGVTYKEDREEVRAVLRDIHAKGDYPKLR